MCLVNDDTLTCGPVACLGRGYDGWREARSRVRGFLSRREDADDALLVSEELVANAICHGAPPVTLQLRQYARRLRIDVGDGSLEPALMRQPTSSGGGFGLHVVKELSTSWGWQTTDHGKRVWAVLAIDGPSGWCAHCGSDVYRSWIPGSTACPHAAPGASWHRRTGGPWRRPASAARGAAVPRHGGRVG